MTPLNIELPQSQQTAYYKNIDRTEICVDVKPHSQGEGLYWKNNLLTFEKIVTNSNSGDYLNFLKFAPIVASDNEYVRDNLSEMEVDNIAIMKAGLSKEINIAKKSGEFDIKSINNAFSKMLRPLAQLPFEDFAIEIISGNFIKVTMRFSENKILMISNSLNSPDITIAESEIIYSYFINRKLIASDVTNFELFTGRFKEYINS